MAKQLLLAAACCTLLTAAAAAAAALPSPALTSANSTAVAAPQRSAYDMIESYGFPRGFLPAAVVRRYTLDRNGSFQVILTRSCRFRVDRTYALHYSSPVAGSISVRSMSGLAGLQLEVSRSVEARVSMAIDRVDRYGDQLRFQGYAGVKTFGVQKFAVSPSCQ